MQCFVSRRVPRLLGALFTLALVGCALTSCHHHDAPRNPEITAEVQLLVASKPKTPDDIKPYDEALVWNEYAVKKVKEGNLPATKIRVAQWSVVAAQPIPAPSKVGETVTLKLVPYESIKGLDEIAASNDLDVVADEPPRFLDLSQKLDAAHTPGPIRFDYRGNLSEKMRLYWKLRGQLRLVVMGNSYAIKGINTRVFFTDEAGQRAGEEKGNPTALNLAPAGGNMKLQCLMLHDYVLPLDKIEWVIWTISPFLFNKDREDDSRYEEFVSSPGLKYDQDNRSRLWPMPAGRELLTMRDLRKFNLNLNAMDFWVQDNRAQTTLPADPDKQRQQILKACHTTRFAWSDTLFAEFQSTLTDLSKKGVRVLLLTPPIHPAVRDAVASDRHGTSHEGYGQAVAHLTTLAQQTPHVWFRDINQDGHHDFTSEEFYDEDHLNGKGAQHLTQMLLQWMGTCH